MRLRNKNILLISPESWDHIFVSKHHYAIWLAKKRNSVYFLNPPGRSCSVTKTIYDNIYEIHYAGFLRGLRKFPGILRKWITRRKYQKIEKLAGVKFDVVWSFDNSVFYDFGALPDSVLKISHIVDYNQDFQSAHAARSADICLCVAEVIRKRLLSYNKNTHKIQHGFNPVESPCLSLPGPNKIKAVYAGNLSIPFIDWEILVDVIKKQPDVDFIFIGPGIEHHRITDYIRVLKSSDNVFFYRPCGCSSPSGIL
jgi:hypothetical protein